MSRLYRNLTGKKLLFRMKCNALLNVMKYLLIAVTAFFRPASWSGSTDSGKPEYRLALATIPA